MSAGDDQEAVRRPLPEKFRADFETITAILRQHVTEHLAAVKGEAGAVASRRALRLQQRCNG